MYDIQIPKSVAKSRIRSLHGFVLEPAAHGVKDVTAVRRDRRNSLRGRGVGNPGRL
jgi:hypothetical protein